MRAESAILAPYLPRALLARLARPIDVLSETVDCTMVFADVSGFTRLSERLARRGNEGAEQLVDVINACFSALLAEAYDRGGSLVKFGGDAMLLLFYDQEGDQQHAARACSAAAAMRRTLREVGQIRVGEANVVLRMSVGVHSGEYGMFVVGGSHREIMFGGPAATTVVAMEAAAGASQILISADTARRLPRGCLGSLSGQGVLLTRPPPSCEWVPPSGLAAPPPEAVAHLLPAAIRAHLLSGSAAPEHRVATIAFLQFEGLDWLIVRHGIDAAARRLDELVRLVQEAVERYDVCFLDSDISADGGKIRLSAGAPRVVGDDEERMLLALRHIVEATPPLPVRVGVNRGPVFTGEVGPSYRRWYAVMGDTVNLAARLGAKAPAGEIYATREVLRGAKTIFDQTPLEPFPVKGKARPVQAWAVGPPVRGSSDQAIRLELPLVGRNRELSVLRSAIADAHRGSGVLIELVGERGAGKSRLLAEAAGLARGMTTLRVACEVYTRDTPYTAWRELLHQLLGVGPDEPDAVVLDRLRAEIELCDPSLAPWMSLIGIVLDVEVPLSVEVTQLSSSARAAKLHEVVLRFLRRALVVPTIVLVEQAHLMDGASVELFQALASELESTAWVVLAARGEDAGGLVAADRPHRRIELGPLRLEDTRALAQATPEAARVPPHVVELAVERSGGSPQFLLDLLAAAAAGQRDELPASVEAATMARIDALSPADAAIVRRAAVLGQAFHPRRLEDVLAPDLSPPDDAFWERMSAVFAREADGQVRFRRPALQEVAYSSLPFKLRRRLHEAVGLRLEHAAGAEHTTDGEHVADPAILSHHFELAGDHARAHRYAMSAAALAAERFSHADAVRLYRRAIEAGRALGAAADGRALADAWEHMGDSLRNVGEPVAAMHAFTEARRLLRGDPLAQARLFHRHAAVAETSEALTQAVRWLSRGLRCLEGLEDTDAVAWRARLRSRLASVRNRQGRWPEAISGCRQAIAEAESVGELRALAHACSTLDLALVSSGRPSDATYSARALEIYQQLGDPEHEAMALNNLGVFAYWDGRWDDAIELYRRSGACGRRAGRPADAAYTDCNVGEILSDQGKLDDAETRLLDARRVWGATGERQGVAFADLLLARVAARRGEVSKALPALEASMRDLGRFGMEAYAGFAAALVAEAQALAGDPSRALEIVQGRLRAADQQRPLLERVAGIALARLGQMDAAERELRCALESARASCAQYDLAATIDMLALLGVAEPELLAERARVLERLKIERLPAPALDRAGAAG